MPSDKKRINLTIPDEIYERLQAYKNETGIVNDATACLQLIVQQLNAHANNKAVLHFLQNSTLEQLQQAATRSDGMRAAALSHFRAGTPVSLADFCINQVMPFSRSS